MWCGGALSMHLSRAPASVLVMHEQALPSRRMQWSPALCPTQIPAAPAFICEFSLCSIVYRRYCMHGLWLLQRRLTPAARVSTLYRSIFARLASASSKSTPTPAPEFSCVILGRPNVGKSTLFNRLVGRRQSLVYNVPGSSLPSTTNDKTAKRFTNSTADI